MRGRLLHVGWVGLLFVLVAGGCSNPKPMEPPSAEQEAAVREKFAELQTALKSGDVDKLWLLLADKSRADADRIAKGIQQAYADTGAEAKAEREKTLGLTEKELAELTGKVFLKSKRFQNKYEEVLDSKIEKVEVHGDNAALYYLEPDGEKGKLIFIRQEGQWKVWLSVPRVNQPQR